MTFSLTTHPLCQFRPVLPFTFFIRTSFPLQNSFIQGWFTPFFLWKFLLCSLTKNPKILFALQLKKKQNEGHCIRNKKREHTKFTWRLTDHSSFYRTMVSKTTFCQLKRIKQTIKALMEIGHTTSADIITIMQTAKLPLVLIFFWNIILCSPIKNRKILFAPKFKEKTQWKALYTNKKRERTWRLTDRSRFDRI